MRFAQHRFDSQAQERSRQAIMNRACARVLEAANVHCDAGETAAFVRQLEYIRSQTYDTRYPDLRARDFIPIAKDVPPGAEYVTFRAYDFAGMAKIIANYGEDLPGVKLIGGEVSVRVKSIGDKYSYSVQDIRTAEFSGSPVDVKRPQAARRMIENSIDMIAMMGVAAAGLPGFITNANVPIISAGSGITGGWLTTATTAQILADLNTIANTVVTQSKTVHKPDTLLLPVTHYSFIATTPYSTQVPDTILSVFLKNSPYIRNVDQSLYLNNTANGGGVSLTANGIPSAPAGGGAAGVARAIAYARNPEYLEMGVPLEFEQLPPQPRELEFDVPCDARTYGTFWHYPLSGLYADGI